MDHTDITELFRVLHRIANALELQAKHQQECNEMLKRQNEYRDEQEAEWKQLQLQWREENEKHQQARDKEANELAEWHKQQQIEHNERDERWRKENMAQEKRNETMAMRLLMMQQGISDEKDN